MLLILGNGFDLQCGLKTDYKEFFKKRYGNKQFIALKEWINNPNRNTIDDESHAITTKFLKTVSVWDIIFIYEDIVTKNPGWYNIENLIFDYIHNDKITHNKIHNPELKIVNGKSTINQVLSDFLGFGMVAYTSRRFNEWLLLQLNIVEKEFAKYVQEQIINTKGYLNNAKILYGKFSNIVGQGDTPLSLINFNYTTPTLEKNETFSYTNIHGTVGDRDIIFGIDEKDSGQKSWINHTETKYIFTKTARKIHNYERKENFVLKKYNDRNIFIYGHSLNDQDYSYFQSIFDVYDISKKEVTLYFGWTNYDKRRKLREETADGAVKLLKYYGDSIGNDSGRNLLHRMLLEKRIKIVEVKGLKNKED